MIYQNHEEFEKELEKLKKEYNGKMGCFVSLSGFVRDYHFKEGKKTPAESMDLSKIDYDIIEEIRQKAIEKFGLLDAIVYHNKGILKVGDLVSSITVFTKHRDEAFLACRYIIDEIKRYH
ncbi:molybdenum cofactor biosynthesis protein MoaE [Methanococcus aeolicus]|uniref:Molybdopterin biosynthesis MoaE protein n=1 Tax=Methanococcus aeolicus (strain ATCC BAA-1280 / DSM 17508 / OCM 812 / Nankai-3) TaxID=419665 RepID=A6UU63_META3|nr:molybdenum cofactor biosynthesis protein MoaE [Methanococcus aeolicus]ABR56035.1 molybdopterin biosynthesis MoaE protein [Methanococcus aeolicus Nankai-3]UXM85360.1 molybdenum cofactor biosynthesis protein MoaE [Methanococcus aeolicus]